MAKVKIFYDNKAGRIELRAKGSDIPFVSMFPDEFADLLWQINDFVGKNASGDEWRRKSAFAKAYHTALRKDTWKWIGGAIKEKLGFKKK